MLFLFCGQGVVSPQMFDELKKQKESAQLLSQANQQLHMDIERGLVQGNLAAQQVAVFLYQAMVVQMLARAGVKPSAALGHSLGEYAAVYVTGAASLAQALTIVEKRGHICARHNAKYPGGMSVVLGLTAEMVAQGIQAIPEVYIANENTEQQIVIGGSLHTLEKAEATLLQAGAKRVIRMAVQGAMHTPLMGAAETEFGRFLRMTPLKAPQIPLYLNFTNQPWRPREVELWDALTCQITRPVRFAELMRNVFKDGYQEAIEIGPTPLLGGLAKRSAPDMQVMFWKDALPT